MYINIKKTVGTALAVALFVLVSPVSAQENSLPKPGITPESPFYFLDTWSETLQELFTFSAEGKVRLQVTFAAERTAELQTILDKDEPSIRAIETVFARIEIHGERAANILNEFSVEDGGIALLADAIASEFDFLDDMIGEILDAHSETLTLSASSEAQALRQKLADTAFESALEEVLQRIADEIDEEVGKPLQGFSVVEDEFDVDIDGDTYSATYRAEADGVVDLALLRERILAQARDWESGDVELEDDSLDITFEKEYASVTVDGIELHPSASVTISSTIHSPEQGMTSINYDVDITLETRSEYLADLLGEAVDDMEDAFEEINEEAEKHLEAEEAARRAIANEEEEKDDLIEEAAEEEITLPWDAFAEFDRLLAQAKSALQADNFVEAKNLVKRAEKSLDTVDGMIDELAEEKEKKEGAAEEAKVIIKEIKQQTDRLVEEEEMEQEVRQEARDQSGESEER